MPIATFSAPSITIKSVYSAGTKKVDVGTGTFSFNGIKVQKYKKIKSAKVTGRISNNGKVKSVWVGGAAVQGNSFTHSVSWNGGTSLSVSVSCIVDKGEGFPTQDLTLNTSFSSLILTIEYDAQGKKTGGDSTDPKKPKEQVVDTFEMLPDIKGEFSHDRQVACIYDKSRGVTLYFDGVIKMQVASQVKIEDETANQKKKYSYVNNAMIQPDEVTLEIIESDVYTNSSTFEGGPDDKRSERTYQYLHELMRDRRKVDLVSIIYTLKDCTIKQLTGVLDENTPNGWSGQIVLHEFMEIGKTEKKKDDMGDVDTDYDSLLFKGFGIIFKNGLGKGEFLA